MCGKLASRREFSPAERESERLRLPAPAPRRVTPPGRRPQATLCSLPSSSGRPPTAARAERGGAANQGAPPQRLRRRREGRRERVDVSLSGGRGEVRRRGRGADLSRGSARAGCVG